MSNFTVLATRVVGKASTIKDARTMAEATAESPDVTECTIVPDDGSAHEKVTVTALPEPKPAVKKRK